jgi:hypothetical protein
MEKRRLMLFSLQTIKKMNNENEESLQSSKGHIVGNLDENSQQGEKPKADSPASAGINTRDEDAADPEKASNETSKGFDRDQEAIDLGL